MLSEWIIVNNGLKWHERKISEPKLSTCYSISPEGVRRNSRNSNQILQPNLKDYSGIFLDAGWET
jgi:hypothetical protein